MDSFRETFIDGVMDVLNVRGGYSRWQVETVYEASMRAGYVIMTEEVFERMDRAEDKLIALENGGVNNWEGYGPAMRYAYQSSDETEDE